MTNKMLTCKTFALKKKKPPTKNVKSQRVLFAVFYILFICSYFWLRAHTSLFLSGEPVLLVWKINGQLASVVIASVDHLTRGAPPVPHPITNPDPIPTCCMIHGPELRGCANSLALCLWFLAFGARACYQCPEYQSPRVIPHNGYWQLPEKGESEKSQWIGNVSSILRPYTLILNSPKAGNKLQHKLPLCYIVPLFIIYIYFNSQILTLSLPS